MTLLTATFSQDLQYVKIEHGQQRFRRNAHIELSQ